MSVKNKFASTPNQLTKAKGRETIDLIPEGKPEPSPVFSSQTDERQKHETQAHPNHQNVTIDNNSTPIEIITPKAPLAATESSMGEDLASDSDSMGSSPMAGSEVSSAADRYGFLGGAQYTEEDENQKIPVEVLRGRERKWLEMFSAWERFMLKKYRKVRDRCRKGIPSSVRARAWQHLCGAAQAMSANPRVFDRLVNESIDPKAEDDIRKDLHRQFPFHEMFVKKGGNGQEDLFRVLKAHTSICEEGYCQAHAPLVAVLLMQMPAEPAFWCMRAICNDYVPSYYSSSLEAIHLDGEILFKLLKKVSPSAYRHLKKQKIEPVLYMTEWFMCIFSRTLPWSSVLRIWDIFLCEGVKVLFRVGLVLLKYGLKPQVTKQCPSMYETIQALRNIDPQITSEHFLMMKVLSIDITEEELGREHERQVNRRAEKLKKNSR